MHERPAYETPVKGATVQPKDNIIIAIQDGSASIIRRTQQLTRYDDAECLDLEKSQQNIPKEQAQQITIKAATGNDRGESSTEKGGMRPDTPAPNDSSNQPPPGPPPREGRLDFVGVPMVGCHDGRHCEQWELQALDRPHHQASDRKRWQPPQQRKHPNRNDLLQE